MLISEQIASYSAILKRAVSNSLSSSYKRTWSRCLRNGGPPQEPDYVADLSLYWVSDFAKLLRIILHTKFSIGVTGVFCHQKPLADFGSLPNPEIGDLLIVLEYREQGQRAIFNSLLLQAKSSKRSSFTIGTGDLHQLKLYEEWPKFKYKRAAMMNGQTRDIHPKCPNSGGKFLLVDPSYIRWADLPGHFPYGCAVPNRSIVLSREFADELIQFLMFNSGKVISDKNAITEDWSRMIWDLLEITKGKIAKRSLSGLGKGFDRQTAAAADGYYCFEGESGNGYFGTLQGGRSNDGNDYSSDDGGGVSTIYVEISEREIE